MKTEKIGWSKMFLCGMFGKATLVAMLTFGLVLTGCSKKDGGASGGFTAKASSSVKENPASDFSYDLTVDGQGIVITSYTGGPGKVVIPSKIEDYPVVEIGKEVFDGSSLDFSAFLTTGRVLDVESKDNEKAGITTIIIPNTVKKIGRSAFANTAITSIVIPDSVTELDFYTITGSGLFSGCKQLTEIKFSDNIEFIPGSLGGTWGLPALQKITLPKNLKQIGEYAFSSAGELTEIIIPDTLTSVEFVRTGDDWSTDPWGILYTPRPDNGAFEGCGKLPIKTRQTIQGWGYTGGF
jgi:hypothetical protein